MINIIPHWLTYFSAMSFSFFITLHYGFIFGEMGVKLEISKFETILFYFVNIIIFFLIFVFYKILTYRHFKSVFIIKPKKFIFLYVVIVLFDLIFTAFTGVGVLFSNAESKYSFLTAIFNPVFLFPIFYLFFRKKISGLVFFVIVVLFSFGQLQKGWTGFFLLIFFFELYFLFQVVSKKKKLMLVFIVPVFVMFVGSYFYMIVEPYKNEIRGLGYNPITYAEGFEKLTSRLTYFPVSLAAYQRADEVVQYYQMEDIQLKEFYGFFKPLVPGSLMPNKDFRSLNNNVKQPYFNLENNTTSDVGFFSWNYILIKSSPLDFFVNLLLIVFCVILIKFVYDSFSSKKGQFDFIIYLILFSVFYTTAPEVVFSRNFFGIVILLPILFLFGGFVLRRA